MIEPVNPPNEERREQVQRETRAAWTRSMRALGRFDFDDKSVREQNAPRLLRRSRASMVPISGSAADELALGSGRREPFEFVQKHISGTDLSVVGRLLGMQGGEKLTRPYEQSGWVYACITALASAVASVGRTIWSKDPELFPDTAERVTSGPLFELLTRTPNEHQSADEFYRAGVTHRRLDGEDVWFLMRANGEPIDKGETPAMIVPWRGSIVDIFTDRNGFPLAFRWPWRNQSTPMGSAVDSLGVSDEDTGAQHHRWFPAHSVVQFRDYDPSNPARGIGAVEVLAADLQSEYQAGRYQSALLANAGDPGGWIITKRRMSRDTQRTTQERLDDETSNVQNRGRWKVVADPDAQIVQNTMTPKDLEFSTLLTWVRDKVASVMGVPPTIIGIYDRATFRNFETAVRQFWTGPNGVIPYLRSVEAQLDARFFSKFGGDEQTMRMRFDVDSIEDLQEDMSEKIAKAIAAAEGGNELSLEAALELFGIEMPEGLTLTGTVFMPASTSTMENIETPPEPAPEPDEDSDGDDDPDDAPPAAEPDEDDADDDADDKALDTEPRDVPQPDESNISPTVDEPARLRAERRAFHVTGLRAFREGRAILVEKEWTRRAERYLRSYLRAQIRRLRDAADPRKSLPGFEAKASFTMDEILAAVQLPRDEWDAKLAATSEPLALRAFVESSESMGSLLGGTGFVATDEAAIEFAKTQTAKLVEGVNSRLARQVVKLTQEHLSAGATSSQLRVAIGEVLPELTDDLRAAFARPEHRAQTIARTETGKAVNGGRYETMKKNNVEKHEWSNSGDDAVRASHVKVEGEVVAVGEKFSNGLHYPLEDTAPIEEIANCRCATYPAD